MSETELKLPKIPDIICNESLCYKFKGTFSINIKNKEDSEIATELQFVDTEAILIINNTTTIKDKESLNEKWKI